MKTIPTMIAASLLFASVSATANSVHDIFLTPVAPTKTVAYELGLNKLSALKASSSYELSLALNAHLGDVDDETLRLEEGAYITVQERIDAAGKLSFVGQVNVDVSYDMFENDD